MAALWRACVPLVCALLVATGRGAVLKVVTSDVGEDAQIAFVSGGAPQGSTVTMTRAEGTGPLEIHVRPAAAPACAPAASPHPGPHRSALRLRSVFPCLAAWIPCC